MRCVPGPAARPPAKEVTAPVVADVSAWVLNETCASAGEDSHPCVHGTVGTVGSHQRGRELWLLHKESLSGLVLVHVGGSEKPEIDVIWVERPPIPRTRYRHTTSIEA